MGDSVDELKLKSVLSHRILTMTGCMGDITGHVFVRSPNNNEMLVRCRNESDWAPAFVEKEAIHRIDLDGNPTEDVGDWVPPPERFIGATVLKTRPDVNCVIHAHPYYQVACSVTGVQIRPIVGSWNRSAMFLALGGIPVFPRPFQVASPEVGNAMLAVMGSKNICLLKGHGNVVTGRTVEEATLRAINIENMAKMSWEIAQTGRQTEDLTPEDVDEFINPKQVASRIASERNGADWSWRYYVKLLEVDGRIPPLIK